MDEHGLSDWKFEFDRGTRRLGVTHIYGKKIGISKCFATMNTWTEVKETVLHEIAHALCGPGEHHGNRWRQTYIDIGGNPNRDYSAIKTPPKKLGDCPNCKKVYKVRRRLDSACTPCCNQFNNGKYSTKFKIVWR